MPIVLQSHLPHIPWTDPRLSRLPGVLPLQGDDWLTADEAFAGQMAERDRLIGSVPAVVHGLQDAARPAAEELYDRVLAKLRVTPGYVEEDGAMWRPDGVRVGLDRNQPLLTLGRLVQEDLCLMQKQGDAHVLTGAILCFPASWTLAEKLGRPMLSIHRPVAHYTDDLAARVQRLLDMIRPEQPLWRMNALVYVDPALHQPRREDDRRVARRQGEYLRAERQVLMRLPQSDAVLFAIHTYVVHLSDLGVNDREALLAARL